MTDVVLSTEGLEKSYPGTPPVRALRGERQRQSAPNTTARTGDQYYFFIKAVAASSSV